MVEQRTTRITKFRVVPWEDILGPTDGLVSWWKLNRNANDAWGTNHGTAYGVTWFPKGAGSFDGADDYVEIPDSVSLDITGDISVEFWVKWKSGTGRVVSKYGVTPKRTWEFYIASDGTSRWRTSYDGSTADDLILSIIMTAGVWTHIVCQKEGKIMKVFFNGEQDPNTLTTTTGLHTNDLNLFIGRYSEDPLSYFNGLIDEVRIYNRALSADEIKKRYLKTRIVPLEVGV